MTIDNHVDAGKPVDPMGLDLRCGFRDDLLKNGLEQEVFVVSSAFGLRCPCHHGHRVCRIVRPMRHDAFEQLRCPIMVEVVGIEQPGAHPLQTILERFRGQVSIGTRPKKTNKTG